MKSSTKAVAGSAAAASITTQPPWLCPARPTRAGSIPAIARTAAATALMSAARPSMVLFIQLPVEAPMPRLLT